VTKWLRLGDYCLKIGSGATPRGGKEAYLAEGPFSLVRSQNVLNDRFSFGGLAFISQAQADQLSNVEVQMGDVLLNITGDSVARVCQVDPAVLPARVNQHVAIVRPNPEVIDARFLRYFFVSPEMQAHMLGLAASGATRNALTKGMIEKFEIPAVPLPEQRAIAATLGALDDKIELNRRMNETLEAMARALFRDWFVDFGPTRAKMAQSAAGAKNQNDLTAPYLSPALWPLFPDRLDDAGKPEGWEVQPLTAFFAIIGGGTPKTSNPALWDGPIPWFSVTDTPAQGSVFVTATEKTITEAGLVGSSARLIPKGTTIISARGTVGNIAVAGCEMTFNQSCYGLSGTRPVGDCATYLIAQNMVSQLQAMAHGSVFSTITRQTFDALSLPMPSPRVLSAFEDAVSPQFEMILANVNESRTLAQTRDLLLPRLMSGELRVAGAARTLEEVL
jgi:type I restriction enzyme S subunit